MLGRYTMAPTIFDNSTTQLVVQVQVYSTKPRCGTSVPNCLLCEKHMSVRRVYLILALGIFALEVTIARGYIPGRFIRESFGDVLVIVLIYTVLRGLTALSPLITLMSSVTIGCAVELLQYMHLADLLGLEPGSVLYTIIGNTFSLLDLVMYLVGGLLSVCLNLFLLKQWGKRDGISRMGA